LAAPLLLWAFICVHDGAGGLLSLVRRVTDRFGDDPVRLESLLGGLVALAFVVAMYRLGAWPERYPGPASSLPGEASVHIPRDVEAR